VRVVPEPTRGRRSRSPPATADGTLCSASRPAFSAPTAPPRRSADPPWPSLEPPWSPDGAPRPRPARSCGRIPSRAPAEGDWAAGKCAADPSSAIRVAGECAADPSSAIQVAGECAADPSSAIQVAGSGVARSSSAIQVAGKRAADPSSANRVAGSGVAEACEANRVAGSGVAEGCEANQVAGRARAPRSAGASATSPGSPPGRAGPGGARGPTYVWQRPPTRGVPPPPREGRRDPAAPARRQGSKGDRDRVPLPPAVAEAPRPAPLERASAQHARDPSRGAVFVELLAESARNSVTAT
jgi:flagellar hook-length control protein FliK